MRHHDRIFIHEEGINFRQAKTWDEGAETMFHLLDEAQGVIFHWDFA